MSNIDAFRKSYRVLPAQLSGQSAKFAFEDLIPGDYEVFATWPSHSSRTDVAVFEATYSNWFNWTAENDAGEAEEGEYRLKNPLARAAELEALKKTLEDKGFTNVSFRNRPIRRWTVDQKPAGRIDQIQVTEGGSGYSVATPPTVTITAPGGSGTRATATAVVEGDTIVAIKLTNRGAGYNEPPEVTVSAPGSGAAASAVATVRVSSPSTFVTSNGSVREVMITAAGSGYSSDAPPAVSIAAPQQGGIPASAVAVVVGGRVAAINITNPGAGYIAAPAIRIANPSSGDPAAATTTLRQTWARFDTPPPAIARKFRWQQLPSTLVVTKDMQGKITFVLTGGSDGDVVADAVALKRVKDKNGKPLVWPIPEVLNLQRTTPK